MEFLELLLVLIALILIIKKTRKRKFGFWFGNDSLAFNGFYLCWPQNRRIINDNKSARRLKNERNQ